MSDSIVKLTVKVTPDHAAMILSLIHLWSNESPELSEAMSALPGLLSDIALELNASNEFQDADILKSMRFTSRDIKLFNALLNAIGGRLLPEIDGE